MLHRSYLQVSCLLLALWLLCMNKRGNRGRETHCTKQTSNQLGINPCTNFQITILDSAGNFANAVENYVAKSILLNFWVPNTIRYVSKGKLSIIIIQKSTTCKQVLGKSTRDTYLISRLARNSALYSVLSSTASIYLQVELKKAPKRTAGLRFSYLYITI